MTGPVQILVVGFDRPTFSGEVLAEFARLREAGIVRLVDLLVVSHSEQGVLETVKLPEEVEADFGDVAAQILGRTDAAAEAETQAVEIDNASTWSLADAIPVGSTAAVALIEHTWAVPLAAAIQRAGGSLLDETWLAPEDRELLDALIATRQT